MGSRKRPTNDPVNSPSHYRQGKIESIDAIESAIGHLKGEEAFLVGQVMKYLFRFRLKGTPKQDLEKASWYLSRLLSKQK